MQDFVSDGWWSPGAGCSKFSSWHTNSRADCLGRMFVMNLYRDFLRHYNRLGRFIVKSEMIGTRVVVPAGFSPLIGSERPPFARDVPDAGHAQDKNYSRSLFVQDVPYSNYCSWVKIYYKHVSSDHLLKIFSMQIIVPIWILTITDLK